MASAYDSLVKEPGRANMSEAALALDDIRITKETAALAAVGEINSVRMTADKEAHDARVALNAQLETDGASFFADRRGTFRTT